MRYPDFDEVLERLRPLVSETEFMCLTMGSRKGMYDAGLKHGVLTDAEYRAANRVEGSTWWYVGD